MSLTIGAFLGPYRVVAHIGSGGMDSPLLVKRKPSF
jgi:hypothetical protein